MTYRLKLSKPGYEDYEEYITVTAGKTTEIKATL